MSISKSDLQQKEIPMPHQMHLRLHIFQVLQAYWTQIDAKAPSELLEHFLLYP